MSERNFIIRVNKASYEQKDVLRKCCAHQIRHKSTSRPCFGMILRPIDIKKHDSLNGANRIVRERPKYIQLSPENVWRSETNSNQKPKIATGKNWEAVRVPATGLGS